jgi:hypothetical protein
VTDPAFDVLVYEHRLIRRIVRALGPSLSHVGTEAMRLAKEQPDGSHVCSRWELGGMQPAKESDHMTTIDTGPMTADATVPPAPAAPNWTDRADTDARAAKFRTIARANGYDVVPDTSPWADGPGIVHLSSFHDVTNKSEEVYVSWEWCCWNFGLVPDMPQPAGEKAVDIEPLLGPPGNATPVTPSARDVALAIRDGLDLLDGVTVHAKTADGDLSVSGHVEAMSVNARHAPTLFVETAGDHRFLVAVCALPR